jgi:hypothetical protein
MASDTLSILKTSGAADALGVPYWLLHQLIRERRLPPPPKDSSGDYVWLPQDVERARAALAARRCRHQAPASEGEAARAD